MSHSPRRHLQVVTAALVILAWLAFPGASLAYHGGHHFDLTREALLMEGFSQNAIQIAQVSNWYDDAYDLGGQSWLAGTVAGTIFPPKGYLWEAASHLHFMHDQTYAQVADEWGRLQANTYAMVRQAESRGDVLGLLVVMGASLHWLQDFYAHSNWADLDWGGDATWFDVAEDVKRARVESGEIEIYTAYNAPRDHDTMNMDSAESVDRARPFEKGYREAFYASCQWVQLIKSWVSPGFWNAARSYANPRADAEATWARKMMWYAGTWKGKFSQSAEDAARMALQHEGDFPGQNKWEEYAIGLARGVVGTTPPAADYAFIDAQNWLVIDTGMVRQTDCSSVEDIDPGDQADFYAKIRLGDGREYIEAFDEGHDVLYPPWLTMIPFRRDTASIHLEYTIWDDDGGTSSDDHCDIAYARNVKDWVWDGSPWDLNTINAAAGLPGYVETDGLQRCDRSCFLGICDNDSIGDGDEARVWFIARYAEQPHVEVRPRIVKPVGPIGPISGIDPSLLLTAAPTVTSTATPTATQAPSATPTMTPAPTLTETRGITPAATATPEPSRPPGTTSVAPATPAPPTAGPTATRAPASRTGPCPTSVVTLAFVCVIPVLAAGRRRRFRA